jgi:hypothetical protein
MEIINSGTKEIKSVREKLRSVLEVRDSVTQVVKSEKEKLNFVTKVPKSVRKVQAGVVKKRQIIENCLVIGRNVRHPRYTPDKNDGCGWRFNHGWTPIDTDYCRINKPPPAESAARPCLARTLAFGL